MTEEKNLETLSTEILETEEREAERFSSSLYERLASQTDMTEEEQTALAAEVEAEVKVLENTSSQLKKAQKWAFDQADELRTRLKEGKTSDSRELLIRRAPANSVIDYEEEKTKNFAAGVNFYKIAIILISGSFAGVIIEMLWCCYEQVL